MKKSQLTFIFTAFIFIVFVFSGKLNAQDFNEDDYKVFYNFKTVKLENYSRSLEVSFKTQNRENKSEEFPVFKAEIKFFNNLGEQQVLLGSVFTNKKGAAVLVLPENHKYLADADGFINITAVFDGSEVLSEQSEEVLFKDVKLELHVAIIDSIKTVTLNAYTFNSLGEQIPVEETDITFLAGGMLSKLKIEEGTIEGGVYEFEYTGDLPGDKDGNLNIYAIFEDHEEFANVIQMKTIDFGTVIERPKQSTNTLWTEAAPIWMYIVLTILLASVWINFIYTFVNLRKIKQEGDLSEITENEEISTTE